MGYYYQEYIILGIVKRHFNKVHHHTCSSHSHAESACITNSVDFLFESPALDPPLPLPLPLPVSVDDLFL